MKSSITVYVSEAKRLIRFNPSHRAYSISGRIYRKKKSEIAIKITVEVLENEK